MAVTVGIDCIRALTAGGDHRCYVGPTQASCSAAPVLTAFHKMATWASLPEIRCLARIAGLEVTAVNGPYAGDEYTALSREMLVVLEAK